MIPPSRILRPRPPGVVRRSRPRPPFRIPLALALLPLLAACGGEAAPPPATEDAPAPVRVVPVAMEVLAHPVTAPGTLGFRDEIPLSFSIGGVIQGIEVDQGDPVRAGQTLGTLEPVEIDAAVTRARSALEKAERDLARMTRLYADSVVARSSLQDAGTAAEVARAELDAALFSRRDAAIRAPAEGSIVRRTADPGSRVGANTPILILGTGGASLVRAGLVDRDVLRVRVGDEAVVRFDALPGETFQGRVERVGAAADPGTGTYPVEVALVDATGLRAGMVGRVEIRTGAGVPVAVIPVDALLDADGASGAVLVLSPDGSRVERRTISLALLREDRVAVSAGLEGVVSVVTAGGAWLDDGAAVRVTP